MAAPDTRAVKRAQEAALKSIAQRGASERRSRLQDQLAAAGLDWSIAHYLSCCFVAGFLIFGAMARMDLPLAIAGAFALLGGWFFPQRYVAQRTERRKQAFLNAFSPAIDMIIRGARSGLSVMDCLTMVANDAASPVREEFRKVIAQLGAGVALPVTMQKLAKAVPTAEVRFFTMLMSAHNQTGGNLTEALTNLATVLHHRERIATKIRIASAEGRISALIIGSLPFLVIGVAGLFAPGYISFLWTDDSGREVALYSLIWLTLGVFVLFRMARIEV